MLVFSDAWFLEWLIWVAITIGWFVVVAVSTWLCTRSNWWRGRRSGMEAHLPTDVCLMVYDYLLPEEQEYTRRWFPQRARRPATYFPIVALESAVAHNNTVMIPYLMTKHTIEHPHNLVLVTAAKYGHVELIAQIGNQMERNDWQDLVVDAAVWNDRFDVLERMSEWKNPSILTSTQVMWNKALFIAYCAGRPSMVRFLRRQLYDYDVINVSALTEPIAFYRHIQLRHNVHLPPLHWKCPGTEEDRVEIAQTIDWMGIPRGTLERVITEGTRHKWFALVRYVMFRIGMPSTRRLSLPSYGGWVSIGRGATYPFLAWLKSRMSPLEWTDETAQGLANGIGMGNNHELFYACQRDGTWGMENYIGCVITGAILFDAIGLLSRLNHSHPHAFTNDAWCLGAAERGSLSALKYLRRIHAPWDHSIYHVAASRPHVLKWILQQPDRPLPLP